MKRETQLNRILDHTMVSDLLASSEVLLGPFARLALFYDRGRRLFGEIDLDDAQISQLWSALRNLGIFISSARDIAAWPIRSGEELVGMLVAAGELPENLEPFMNLLVLTLENLADEAIARRAIAEETLDHYREINVLYNIGETLGAGLGFAEVCRRVLAESMKLIRCSRGSVLLVDHEFDPGKPPSLKSTASVGMDDLPKEAIAEGLSVATDVLRSGRPRIVNSFQPAGMVKTPVLCAPLRIQDGVLGVVFLAEKPQNADFTAADEKLLYTLATQAAISIENARLLDSVKKQRDEIARMKNFMDNIFASIASGVITTDINNVITSCNRAAEAILSLPAQEVLDRPYSQVLDFLNNTPLPMLIDEVLEQGRTFIDFEISSSLPTRGNVNLNMSLSRLRGSAHEPLGVTIVMDDVTEKKKIERERNMVRRYLTPELVDSLPDDLEGLKLRGERQEITILFADIRGFTSFSEIHSPEMVVEVINRYFDLAANAVRNHNGIVDKYLGDAVMALFNTPLLEAKDHAMDAVKAALDLKLNIARYHETVETDKLSFGVGIYTGEAVVGNVGTIDRIEYTAIGDAVNVAKRLQETSAAGQILMGWSTWEHVRDRVVAQPLQSIKLRGRRSATAVLELVDLMPAASEDHKEAPPGANATGE